MLEEKFEKLYLQFRANYYRRMVERIGTREGSLSATESYCVEIIQLLDKPTLTQFARFLNISVPNANYKVNCLVKKGYVKKRLSPTDRREHLLILTEKAQGYYRLNRSDNDALMLGVRAEFSPNEVAMLETLIEKMLVLMEQIGNQTPERGTE